MRQKTLSIDFDGVIHRYSKGWQDGSIYDPPMESAIEHLKELVDKGWRIVIFTTRLNPEVCSDVKASENELKNWLSKNGFQENTHYHELTALKPIATAYIDDRAAKFTNWSDISKQF